MPLFKRVTIVGLGLIGGSLGMAIRRRRLATTVVGLSRHASTLRRARARGAIDVGTTNAKQAVEHADLVILATPVDTIVPQALRVVRWMRAGSVLSDVGSTKAHIVQTLERRLPSHVAFVGAHPLAGSEQRGIAAADANLFDGSACVLTPTRHTNPRSLKRVAGLWRAVTSHVVPMSPQRQDRVRAGPSPLPHLLAYGLSLAVSPGPLPCAPPSFLQTTRVAKSDPDLWDDILLSNRDEVLRAMAQFERQWRTLARALTRRDRDSLRRLLARAKSKRDALEK